MKYLNLTDGFNPYGVHPEGVNLIKYEKFFFNGGEPHIKLDMDSFKGQMHDVTITIRINSMNDFGMLAMATEALNQCGLLKSKFLFVPYFPGARQDRRMIPGEPLTSWIYANWINDFGYSNIVMFDAHSDVIPALVENSNNLDNHKLVEECLCRSIGDENPSKFNLISPDAGSNKKIKDLGVFLSKNRWGFDLIKCDKSRDTSTGKLTGFEVYANDLEGKDCIIVDDICDGGGTFIGLAKELKKKNAGDIYLIVSHGIFSKPLKELKPYFKKIYTTNSWRSEFGWEQAERDSTDLVEIVEFKDFM